MTDSNGNVRMAPADKWQIVVTIAGLILMLAVPVIGISVVGLIRLAVVETKVEDLRTAAGLPPSKPADMRIASQNDNDT